MNAAPIYIYMYIYIYVYIYIYIYMYIYIYIRVCTRSKASIGRYYLERGRKKECMYLKVKFRRSKV